MGQWLDGTGVYLGVQGFTARDWMGTFYPPDIPARDQLAVTSSQLRSNLPVYSTGVRRYHI